MNFEYLMDCVLTDNIDEASNIFNILPNKPKYIGNLLTLAKNSSPPLIQFKSDSPEVVVVQPSHTCNVGCEMCSEGYDKVTQKYNDYLYLLPYQFESIFPWLKNSKSVQFVGTGETLESPYLSEYIEKIDEKVSMVITSGVPLNQKKTIELIRSNLKILNFSFEGKTSTGHGGDKDSYINKFWSKIKMVQEIKNSLDSFIPAIHLTITVNNENIDQLDEIFNRAMNLGVKEIFLLPMLLANKSLKEKSIFNNFKESIQKLIDLRSRWENQKLEIQFLALDKEVGKLDVCPFVDNFIMFNGKDSNPRLCCGDLSVPLKYGNIPPETYWNSFPLRYFKFLHLAKESRAVPANCENCWAMNLKQYSDSKSKTDSTGSHFFELYQRASSLKEEGSLQEAKDLFEKNLSNIANSDLKGKVYFHLGEIYIAWNNFSDALACMELAVQNCFAHRKAYTYLSLLYRILGDPKVGNIKLKYSCEFDKKFLKFDKPKSLA